MKRTILFAAPAMFFTLPAFADGLSGATVAITNTFQGAQTENVEVDVAAFGLANNQFAEVGEDVEFPAFITLYNVDISADSIGFARGDSDFAQSLAGPTPQGNHDRNYFLFDLDAGKAITAVTFDADASDLIDGSAEPIATVIGPNGIVIDFAGGVIRGSGFNPVFAVTVEYAG